MQNPDRQERNRRGSKWLTRLGPAAFAAGILFSQSSASADPLVHRLVEQAKSRVIVVSRREEQGAPKALVLEPLSGTQIARGGHRSHSSHSSHSSHRSSATTGHASHTAHASHSSHQSAMSAIPTYTPPRSSYSSGIDTTPSVPRGTPSRPATSPSPSAASQATSPVKRPAGVREDTNALVKIVSLMDGSELVGHIEARNTHLLIDSAYGQFMCACDEIKAVKTVTVASTLSGQETGDYLVTLQSGRKYRAELAPSGDAYLVRVPSGTVNISKSSVLAADEISSPATGEAPAESEPYWVTLQDGTTIRATLCRVGSQYELKSPQGTVTVAGEEILLFVKDKSPSVP